MTFQETANYLASQVTQSKVRVILVPVENWTELRQSLHRAGYAEIRLSALVTENAWLPSPEEVLGRVRGPGSLLGLDGYLALLNETNRRHAIEVVKRFVDGDGSPGVTFLLQNSEENRALIAAVFANPRYREGRQIVEIAPRNDAMTESKHPEILLVGSRMAADADDFGARAECRCRVCGHRDGEVADRDTLQCADLAGGAAVAGDQTV